VNGQVAGVIRASVPFRPPPGRGPHPSLAAEGGNARGGLRQPYGTGRYGVKAAIFLRAA
jgi:hypothetical protein